LLAFSLEEKQIFTMQQWLQSLPALVLKMVADVQRMKFHIDMRVSASG